MGSFFRILGILAAFLLFACGNVTLHNSDGDNTTTDNDLPQNDDTLTVTDTDGSVTQDEDQLVADNIQTDEGADDTTADIDELITDDDLDGTAVIDDDTISDDDTNDDTPVDTDYNIDADIVPDADADTDETNPNGDSDGDGISDEEEAVFGTDPTKKDTDGDGDEDLAEVVYGSNPTNGSDTIPENEYYLVLPYAPVIFKSLSLSFTSAIESIDVALLVDSSGSMQNEFSALKSNFTTEVFTPVRDHREDSLFGLATFEWQPPFTIHERMTDDSMAMNEALAAIGDATGDDEYAASALYLMATSSPIQGTVEACVSGFGGCEQTMIPDSIFNYPEADCIGALGEEGRACFRHRSMPIFVTITDESLKECPLIGNETTNDACRWSVGGPFNKPEATAAMNAIGAKFIGIDTGFDDNGVLTDASLEDFGEIGIATLSIDDDGNPFRYHTATVAATDLNSLIADAVIDFTTRIDLDMHIEAYSTQQCNATPLKEFLSKGKTFKSEPSTGVQAYDEENFYSVTQGTLLWFEAQFINDFCQNTSNDPVVYELPIELRGNGSYISSRRVYIIIPRNIP